MKWSFIISLLVILVVLISCTSTPPAPTPTIPETSEPVESITPTPPATESLQPTPKPTPGIPTTATPPATSPPDTTSPSAITGSVAGNAYDGKVNLWWDKSTATDFDHYNIYLDKTEIVDVTGMKASQQIEDIATCRYQATGLEDGTEYYFTVTAVDKNGNEDVTVTSVSATPTPMPSGTKDPDIIVDIYQPDRVWAGTTFWADNHNPAKPRIIEVNMLGEVVWECPIPQPANEAELLPNDNILYTSTAKGVYEIDRNGKVVWQYLTSKIDHDADRLPNGNTIFVFGMNDQKSDAQVTEVNSKGEVVWQWYAKDYFDKPPYSSIYEEGWTHINAVTRLPNGNTMVSLRNFSMVAEVDSQGTIVRTIGEGTLHYVHDPEVLPNGNILGALLAGPFHATEINSNSGAVVWQYGWPRQLLPQITADANRLPNGSTLIVGKTKMVEVTSSGEIVWQLGLREGSVDPKKLLSQGFFKADRISAK
jgi:hypothetical protein